MTAPTAPPPLRALVKDLRDGRLAVVMAYGPMGNPEPSFLFLRVPEGGEEWRAALSEVVRLTAFAPLPLPKRVPGSSQIFEAAHGIKRLPAPLLKINESLAAPTPELIERIRDAVAEMA